MFLVLNSTQTYAWLLKQRQSDEKHITDMLDSTVASTSFTSEKNNRVVGFKSHMNILSLSLSLLALTLFWIRKVVLSGSVLYSNYMRFQTSPACTNRA